MWSKNKIISNSMKGIKCQLFPQLLSQQAFTIFSLCLLICPTCLNTMQILLSGTTCLCSEPPWSSCCCMLQACGPCHPVTCSPHHHLTAKVLLTNDSPVLIEKPWIRFLSDLSPPTTTHPYSHHFIAGLRLSGRLPCFLFRSQSFVQSPLLHLCPLLKSH